jgi:AraC family transcriptional activator of pyochelin receptor
LQSISAKTHIAEMSLSTVRDDSSGECIVYLPANDFDAPGRRSSDTMAVGVGALPKMRGQPGDVMLGFDAGAEKIPTTVTLHPSFDPNVPYDIVGRSVMIALARSTLEGRFDCAYPTSLESFHLSQSLRAIVSAMQSCAMADQARQWYLRGKAMELLCETMVAHVSGLLVEAAKGSALFQKETLRMLAVHDFVDLNWRQKLTIDQIGRACGMNRSKLTTELRALFDRSVFEAITERRFDEAKVLLITTETQIASVAYALGYDSCASFTRAFRKWVGMSPAEYRHARFGQRGRPKHFQTFDRMAESSKRRVGNEPHLPDNKSSSQSRTRSRRSRRL